MHYVILIGSSCRCKVPASRHVRRSFSHSVLFSRRWYRLATTIRHWRKTGEYSLCSTRCSTLPVDWVLCVETTCQRDNNRGTSNAINITPAMTPPTGVIGVSLSLLCLWWWSSLSLSVWHLCSNSFRIHFRYYACGDDRHFRFQYDTYVVTASAFTFDVTPVHYQLSLSVLHSLYFRFNARSLSTFIFSITPVMTPPTSMIPRYTMATTPATSYQLQSGSWLQQSPYILPAQMPSVSQGSYILPAQMPSVSQGPYILPTQMPSVSQGPYILPAQMPSVSQGPYILPAQMPSVSQGPTSCPPRCPR